METYSFTLLMEGVDLNDMRFLDALYAGGCNDATFGVSNGVAYGDFDREERDMATAVLSAIDDVERAVPGLRVVRVEPEDLVSAADIAMRLGRTRASISQLIDGDRGPGNFPQPAVRLGGTRVLWRWADIADWFREQLGTAIDPVPDAHVIAAINGSLDIRRHASHIGVAESRRIASWLRPHLPNGREAKQPSHPV